MELKEIKSKEVMELTAALLQERLIGLELITFKRMFGGQGVFHDNKMFGLVDSKGNCFLKADESILSDFEQFGTAQHSRMPYYAISEELMDQSDELLNWVKRSIEISK